MDELGYSGSTAILLNAWWNFIVIKEKPDHLVL